VAVVRFVAVAAECEISLLTEPELTRLGRLRDPADRAAYTAAHVLVRTCAAELLGVAPRAVTIAQRCARCERVDHGAPYVLGERSVTVSLSHSRGFVAAMAAAGPCGIDVEALPAAVPLEALSDAESEQVARAAEPAREAVRLWVRKEAVAKATGQDLTRPAGVVVPPGLAVHEWSTEGALGAWVLEQS
jgi:4'-phosphopantetheinyl transferase